MKILKAVIDIISDSVLDHPPEIGGILGSRADNIIDEVIIDIQDTANTRPCSYYPNVNFLNRSIQNWQENDISFRGIFHTHFAGVKSLSVGDKKYITEIMNAMPQHIDTLFFPVFVLPNRELVCYKAVRTDEIVNIVSENLDIV